jgi:hypothetical protein
MLEIRLILLSAVLFGLLHTVNGWIFSFAQVTPHIGWIYLPAFLRLVNVLVLGNLRGTVATALGGVLLMLVSGSISGVGFLNVASSCSGPLIAVALFRFQTGREVSLVSLKDLAALTLAYCVANALAHHLIWTLFDPAQVLTPEQLAGMMVGDFSGAMIGAYGLKWFAQRFKIGFPARSE